jgi:hypothetical protein
MAQHQKSASETVKDASSGYRPDPRKTSPYLFKERPCRQWLAIPPGLLTRPAALPAEVSSFKMTIMTYNILAQSLIKRFLFPYCDKETLQWKYRKMNLLNEILGHRPDVACFQVNAFRSRPVISRDGLLSTM